MQQNIPLQHTPAREASPRHDSRTAGAPIPVDRRRFLEATGYGLFLAALNGCSRAPSRQIFSLPSKSEDSFPGQPRYLASTCGACPAGCGVLVKTRDGRPIKLEGNPQHPVSRGGLCAVGQAAVLEVYDSRRLRRPRIGGKEATWEQVDREVRKRLAGVSAEKTAPEKAPPGSAVRLLTGTIHSPTTRAAIDRLLAAVPAAKHVAYDPLPASAISAAHQQTHGLALVPRYCFEKAAVIVSLDVDFLGTWISPVEYAAGYAAGRTPHGQPATMSYHLQVESRWSLTGGQADQRWVESPDALGGIAGHLAAAVARCAGQPSPVAPLSPASDAARIERLATRLWESRGRSLVVSGSQDVSIQVLCNRLNELLGNYGQTLDLARASQQRLGDEAAVETLLAEIEAGQVGLLVIAGVNPAYDGPHGERFQHLLAGSQAPFTVRLTQHWDETAEVSRCVAPESHWLEAWGDAEPVVGVAGVCQPTLPRLGASRTLLECLLAWTPACQNPTPHGALAAIQSHWKQNILPRSKGADDSFLAFWEQTLRTGSVELPAVAAETHPAVSTEPIALATEMASDQRDRLHVVLYPKVGLLDGAHALNPWLQELPDPVTKAVWDNYACLAPRTAEQLGVADGDMLRVKCAGTNAPADLELPVLIQPGQHERVVAIPLGYGRKGTERFHDVGPQWLEGRPSVGDDRLVGSNAAPWLRPIDGRIQYHRSGVQVEATGRRHPLARTQQHHHLAVPAHLATPGTELRTTIEETSLAAYRENPAAGRHAHHEFEGQLWSDDHATRGHLWGMAIDLNRCTGCSACVIACQAENNVPVVGKDEVARSREMHWLRIDRYYREAAGELRALHQPMLCQHCAHAPCENVCPVLATVHSSDGLNQQVYNRCVGTRYCANNCPYKVRRFNWFNYSQGHRLENAALNPDITIRSRGVMEKCSFCVQRIQDARVEANRAGAPLADGAIQPACQQSCPTRAIVFGDRNDPQSAVANALKEPRHFFVLAELDVRPAVGYLRVVRNVAATAKETHHG